MNSDFNKLRQKQSEELAQQTNSFARNQPGRKFESVEELLRHDAAQNPVPPEIAERVNESISMEPPPSKSWWKRIFG
jgi:hypothetical protein